MKYTHLDDNGKFVNFVEWDGTTPFKVDGTLVPYVSDVHEPHTIPQPAAPVPFWKQLWQRFLTLWV